MDNHNITTSSPNLKVNVFETLTIDGTLQKSVVDNNKNEKQCEKITNSETKKIKKKKNRCTMCNKKLGLLGFECKCNLMFCSSHLNPETHSCTFDYKSEQSKKLEKTLVKVVADKVIRI